MRLGISATAALVAIGLLAAASPAAADPNVVYGPRTDAYTSAQTHQGPNVAGSQVYIINGAAQPGYSASGGGGTDGGGDVNNSHASAFQNGGTNYGQPLYATASASASLSEGRLRATTGATGPNNFGTPAGTAQANLYDTLFFNNTSGGDVSISFTYAFDGRMTDTNGDANPGGVLGLVLGCDYYYCFNGDNQAIRFAGSGNIASSNMNYYFNDDTPSYFGENIYGGTNANFVTGLGAGNGVGGDIVGWITANLIVPTGATSLGVHGFLNLSCSGGSQCDFGHTGQLSFGALPTGLTYSSASGVFLTAPTGAVPEPASWAMMIAGFALVGAALRRLRTTVAYA